MEHIFDNKKILEFTKNLIKAVEPKKEKPVEEAVGMSKDEKKVSLKKSNVDNSQRKVEKRKIVQYESYEIGDTIEHEEYGEGSVISLNGSELEIVFDHGIEVFELEEDYHPSIEFHVTDKNDHVKGKYSTIKRARSAKDKHDSAHGSYAHSIKYYHKDKKKYVEFSETGPDSK